MPPAAVIEALLDHGVSHYTRCPWDLPPPPALRTAKAALARRWAPGHDSFIDVVANTACVKGGHPPSEVYRHLGGGPLQGL